MESDKYIPVVAKPVRRPGEMEHHNSFNSKEFTTHPLTPPLRPEAGNARLPET